MMGLLSKILGPPPRRETQEMDREFDVAARELRENFAHCTERERRGLYAMQCWKIFGRHSGAADNRDAFALACAALSHSWWITGLALQGDRKQELRRAIKHQTWREKLGSDQLAVALADWAAHRGPASNEEKAAEFAAELWVRLELPRRDLPDPRHRQLS